MRHIITFAISFALLYVTTNSGWLDAVFFASIVFVLLYWPGDKIESINTGTFKKLARKTAHPASLIILVAILFYLLFNFLMYK